MTEFTEPPEKKAKMDIPTIDDLIENIRNSKKNLQPVLADEINSPIQLVRVYIGHVKDPKDISRMFEVLHEKIPLKDLQHLKRARKREILLCPTSYLGLDSRTSIYEYLENYAEEIKDNFVYFKEVDVPLKSPLTRKQYLECSKYWSVNFHPNKTLEKLTSDEVFNSRDLSQHRLYMSMALDVAKHYKFGENLDMQDIKSGEINAAVVVDPSTRSVIAVSFDNRQEHPVQHAIMMAIDNVAKTQDGGAWNSGDSRTGILAGIDKFLLIRLKNMYHDVYFGAKPFVSKRVDEEKSADSPYLCTGYDIYLLREPCVMCSMALVHARVKRVFFCFNNMTSGALISKTKLQSVESLNHHFEVYTGFI